MNTNLRVARFAVSRSVCLSLFGFALLAAIAAPARSETRRIAVVVGSNRGEPTHAPLRYAEEDAVKISDVLSELGGLSPSDVLLLRGPSLTEVRAALDEATRGIARWHSEHRGQVVLVFYFSGHSDGQVLELSGRPLPFSELRRRLTDSGADVRLAIVDSCRSGALLALKGGSLGPAFDIRLADDLGSTGEALIASTAADEAALESSEIGASFFSHHFVSGLRGAADASGDGLVTLAEAYQYAFTHTLRATSDTLVGPQHPAYDYHLAGRADLVLTELRRPSAVLDLPWDFDRLLLVATATEQVVAEIGPRSAHRIAVTAGEYQLRGWRGSQAFGARVRLKTGQERRLAATEFVTAVSGAGTTKGIGGPEAIIAASPAPPDFGGERPWALSAAVGLTEGVADGATLGIARVGLDHALGDSASFGAHRLSLAAVAGSGRAPGLRENRFGVELMPTWWVGRGRVHMVLGIGLGAGIALERTDSQESHWSGLGWVSPTAGVEFQVADRTALVLSGQLPVTALRRDGRVTATLLPTASVGVSRSF